MPTEVDLGRLPMVCLRPVLTSELKTDRGLWEAVESRLSRENRLSVGSLEEE